jgi:hypothetical protein
MKIWVCRILICLVLLDNFQAAVFFMASPDRYIPGFDLSGPAGRIAIQSIGILFLMWCVPYFFAAVHPIRFRVSHIEACIMQAVGIICQTVLLFSLPHGLVATPVSLERFIIFDFAGLVLLLAALWISLSFLPWNRMSPLNP